MAAKKKPGVVKVSGGKEDKMVVARIEEFRTNPITKDWGIDSDFLYHAPNESCVIKSSIYDESGRLRGTGIAWDHIKHSKLHGKSFVELCETSAIGRALSNIGLAGGTEYASADEIYFALQETVKTETKPEPEEKPELKVVDTPEPTEDEEAEKKAQKIAWGKLNSAAKTMSKETFLEKIWADYKKTAPAKYIDAIEKSSMPGWLEAFDAREK